MTGAAPAQFVTVFPPPALLDLHRVEAFFDGKLSPGELVVLAQDALEAGYLLTLGPKVFNLIIHYIDRNLVTTTGRYLH